MRLRIAFAIGGVALVAVTCVDGGIHPPTPLPVGGPANGGTAVLVGAGDIAGCATSYRDEATAALLDEIEGTVFTVGDNVYPYGSASDYHDCFDPSWGRHRARIRPAAGNAEYLTSEASGYFGYFGANAGSPGEGYYSYDLGAWHIVVLNSNIAMTRGSRQEQWLRDDLAASGDACTLAYWHHARFSSGSDHGSSTASRPLWEALYDAGAEVVLSGHDHGYERFGLQTPDGAADPQRGIRQFVVGTGGGSLKGFGTPAANSEVRSSSAHGVLKLTLRPDGYDWEFVPVAGRTFTDRGTGHCVD